MKLEGDTYKIGSLYLPPLPLPLKVQQGYNHTIDAVIKQLEKLEKL